MSKRHFLFCALVILLSVQTAFADTFIQGEFWTELEPFVPDTSWATGSSQIPLNEITGKQQISHEEAIKRCLEEIRIVLSGMIYGYRFVYEPGDAAREISEVFTLEPVSRIPWGDSSLSITETRVEGSRFFIRVRYRLNPSQESWWESWKSQAFPVAGGVGRSSMFDGYDARHEALSTGIKMALREYLRVRIPNKPRRVSGMLQISKIPYTVIDSGDYVVRVETSLNIEDILPYAVY